MRRDHVAQRAGLLVVRAAVLDAERLRGGDLHEVDVAAVPHRLEDAVGEAQDQQVLHGLLGEVVVDAVDLPLVEHLPDDVVELGRAVARSRPNGFSMTTRVQPRASSGPCSPSNAPCRASPEAPSCSMITSNWLGGVAR